MKPIRSLMATSFQLRGDNESSKLYQTLCRSIIWWLINLTIWRGDI